MQIFLNFYLYFNNLFLADPEELKKKMDSVAA